MKTKLLSVIGVIFVLHIHSTSAFACDGTLKNLCTVQDTKNNFADARHYQDVKMLAEAYKGDNTGLANLWMSGSGRPNILGFQMIKELIEKNTAGKVKTIIDLDLRKESHLYLNDNTIYLSARYDLGNVDKTDDEALAAEREWLDKLKTQSYVYNVLSGKLFDEEKFSDGIDVPIQSIMSEEEAATQQGFAYVHIPNSTHNLISAHSIDLFIELVRNLPADTWVHVHCRGGNGRTTTFMVMYDMLHNADKVSFIDIIKRHAALPPHYNMFDVDMDGRLFRKFCEHRLKFLIKFYQFSQVSIKGYKGLWSEWLTASTGRIT